MKTFLLTLVFVASGLVSAGFANPMLVPQYSPGAIMMHDLNYQKYGQRNLQPLTKEDLEVPNLQIDFEEALPSNSSTFGVLETPDGFYITGPTDNE